MLVEHKVAELLEVFWCNLLDDAFGDDSNAVVVPRQVTLDDRSCDDVNNLLQGDGFRCELLGDDRQGCPCRTPHAKRQVSRRTPHSNREVPAVVARTCVFHEVLDFLRAKGTRRLEAKCRNAFGQRQIVVDGLRHMDDVDRLADPARIVRHRHGAVRRVVAADGHDMCDAQFRQGVDDRAQIGLLLRRIVARHLQDAAARQVDAVHSLHVEAHILLLAACEA